MPGQSPTNWRRWFDVFLASCLINTSYGTMSYAFSVLVTEQAAGGDFGKGTVAAAFGVGLLVSGVCSVGVGTVSDLIGSRPVLAIGSVVGATGLALLSVCQEAWQVFGVMALVLGPAMAATFYEPVYVLMNRWFTAVERPKAYGVLTLLSGVSITIFTPLTQFLVDTMGWRPGTAVLGGILVVVGLIVAALVRPGVEPPQPANAPPRGSFWRETVDGVRQTTAVFWVFSIAFFAGTAAMSGYSFHMISQLETRGFEAGAVAAAIGLTGIISLPGRLLLPSLTARFSSSLMLASCLGLLALAAWIASMAAEWWQVWVYVGVFGLVFGAVFPLRTLVISERFAGPYFGRVIGLQALLLAVARAVGPVIVGILGTDQSAYTWSFRAAAVVLVASAVVTAWGLRKRASPTLQPG